MRNFKLFIATLLLVLFFVAIPASAGQQQKVTLHVDGLACSFCAYGLEKKLQKIESVEKLDIKINDGLVVLYFKENAKIDKKLIAEKVKEAGFTLRDISIESRESGKAEGEEITLKIEGMRCEGCVERVENTLSKLECVREATVNLEKKEAEVVCTGDEQDRKKVLEAIDELGFKAVIDNKRR